MTPRRKTSRKRSAASSIAKRLEPAVFYLDESICSRTLSEELARALRDAKVGAFVLTAGQATAEATAVVVLARLAKILNIFRSERKPFLYTLGMTGALSRLKIR